MSSIRAFRKRPMSDEKTIAELLASAHATSIRASRTAIIVAVIAALTSLSALFLSYFLTERVRTDIAAQTLALERMKVDVASAAQRTSEMAARIEEARLHLDRRIASTREGLENKKIQIEDKRAQTEDVRLTPDFTKLSNDLRPTLDVSCQGDTSYPRVIRMECSFKNRGAHRTKIVPTGVSMLGRRDQKGVAGAIERIDNAEENNILPGGTGTNTYDIVLTENGATIKNPIISIEFLAVTDQLAINMTKRLAKGIITDEELKNLSEQTYTQQVWFEKPNPAIHIDAPQVPRR